MLCAKLYAQVGFLIAKYDMAVGWEGCGRVGYCVSGTLWQLNKNVQTPEDKVHKIPNGLDTRLAKVKIHRHRLKCGQVRVAKRGTGLERDCIYKR